MPPYRKPISAAEVSDASSTRPDTGAICASGDSIGADNHRHDDKLDTPPDAVDVTFGIHIPLRDGVHLHANLYRPREQSAPLPAIFTLTPYSADNYHDCGMYFAAAGFAFLTVDVRGRGNSEGEFEPFLNEGQDGHDAVEWLATQPWCDGQVAMWGGSYAGFDQWATLRLAPPHLATVAPVASVGTGVDYPALNNITYTYVMQWLTFVGGRTPNNNLFRDQRHWVHQFRRHYLEERPFDQLDQVVGFPNPHFQEWIRHPATPLHWQRLLPTPAQFAAIDRPVLTLTGHYDDDQPGALYYYRQHMLHGTAAACDRHYLVIGPWDHPGTRTPQSQVGGLGFGPASRVDLKALHRDWYRWVMRAGDRPAFLRDRVAVYLTGAECWGYAPSLEAVTAGCRPLFLQSDGNGASSAFAAGDLVEAPSEVSGATGGATAGAQACGTAVHSVPANVVAAAGTVDSGTAVDVAPTMTVVADDAVTSSTGEVMENSGPNEAGNRTVMAPDTSTTGAIAPAPLRSWDEYAYDPRDLRPATIETEPFDNWITDQRYALNLFGNGVVYHSAPLPADTDIAGQFRLLLWLELDVPDTDFLATVYEILPDGGSIMLSQDVLRARYRHSLTEETFVTPGTVECYEFARFPFIARRLRRGSRLRLVIRCPNSIYWQKNRNSGGDVSRETAAEARTAHVRVYHDTDRPSRLEVPLAAPLWSEPADSPSSSSPASS